MDTVKGTPLPRFGSYILPFQAELVKSRPAWNPSRLPQGFSGQGKGRYSLSAALAVEATCTTLSPQVFAPENPYYLVLLKIKHSDKLVNPDSKDYLGVRFTWEHQAPWIIGKPFLRECGSVEPGTFCLSNFETQNLV